MLTKAFIISVSINLNTATTRGKATNNIVYLRYGDENWLQSESELKLVIERPRQ